MMNWFRKNMRTIFTVTIVAFVGGTFISFGSITLSKSNTDTVAVVNGKKLSYRTFLKLVDRAIEGVRSNKGEVTDAVVAQKRTEVLQDMIQQEVFYQEAKKYGITVSDGELLADLRRYPAFQSNGQFNRQAYARILFEMLHTTPEEFEQSRRMEISFFKLRQFIASSVKISDQELQFEYGRTHKGNMASFAKDHDKFLEEVRQQKTGLVFNEWFKSINQGLSGNIKVYLDEIEKGQKG